jgi:hypothetical protein
VSAGDVLQLLAAPPNATDANLLVLSSKGGQECGKSTTVSVTLNDLQDMQNYMRETIDQGLGEMQSAKGGLPPEPLSARAAVTTAPFVQGAPPEPDPGVEIAQQAQEADRAEREAGAIAQSSPNGTGARPNGVSVGMSVGDVTAILGEPRNIVNVGAKQIYLYADRKITFNAGTVIAVQ